MQYKHVTNLHVSLNLIGFATGIIHGLLLVEGLDPFSLSLALIMTVMTGTGTVLRFAKSVNAKLLGRIIHSQLALLGLLVTLAWLHVMTAISG